MAHISHIKTVGDVDVIETVGEHCRNVAAACSVALAPARLARCGELVGYIHDMGKCTSLFDEYIRRAASGKGGERGSVNHTFAAVIWLLDKFRNSDDPMKKFTAELLAFAVGSHHGIFDCAEPLTFDKERNGFLHRLNCDRDGIKYAEARDGFFEECVSQNEIACLFSGAVDEVGSACAKIRESFSKRSEYEFANGMLARLILGGLIKADWRETARFMGTADVPPIYGKELFERCFDVYKKKLAKFSADSCIAVARQAISSACIAAGERASGIYTLSVPTGAGKTLASLGFALSHALKHGKRRIIYAAPLMTILDQNTEVWRRYLFENSDEAESMVLEHCSDVASKLDEEALRAYRALSGGWDAPFVVTTTVQLLNTLFDSRSSCIRRMPALADSVIIIDEVQAIPQKLLSQTNIALDFLSGVCGATVVLCSATQPVLGELEHGIKFAARRELVQEGEFDRDAFKRTRVDHVRDARGMSVERICDFVQDKLQDNDSILIICNTKRTAARIFEKLKFLPDIDIFHLSAGMCKKHRTDVLDRLYASLERSRVGGKKTVCVSTQVIEAGVDISFSCVVRMLSGLDSIAQSAGRCNRSGEYGEVKNVYVIKPHSDIENLRGLKEIVDARDATESVCATEGDTDLLREKNVESYYRALFSGKTNRFDYPLGGEYKGKTLYELLSGTNAPHEGFYLAQSLKTAGDLFSVFGEKTCEVIVPYGEEGKKLVCDLYSQRAAFDPVFVKDTLKKCTPYTVSLYEGAFAAFCNAGYIHTNDLFNTVNELLYDDEVGLIEPCDIAKGGI